jgi:hypothetical protein
MYDTNIHFFAGALNPKAEMHHAMLSLKAGAYYAVAHPQD